MLFLHRKFNCVATRELSKRLSRIKELRQNSNNFPHLKLKVEVIKVIAKRERERELKVPFFVWF